EALRHRQGRDELGRGPSLRRREGRSVLELLGLCTGRRSGGLLAGSRDHAAGDRLARVPGRVRDLVVGTRVDDEGAAVAREDRRAGVVAERDALIERLVGGVALVVDRDVRQVAGMWALRVLEPVLRARGV